MDPVCLCPIAIYTAPATIIFLLLRRATSTEAPVSVIRMLHRSQAASEVPI